MTDRLCRSRVGTGLRLRLACLTLLTVATACRGSHTQPAPIPEPVLLVVRNQGFFDVNVYVLPAPSSASAIRLATVTGNSTARIKIAPNQLQMGYLLIVRLHAIGSRYWWDSPSVTLDAESIAHLDIASDPDGNLSRSTLYTSAADSTGDHQLQF